MRLKGCQMAVEGDTTMSTQITEWLEVIAALLFRWSYLLLLCLTGSVLAASPCRDENIVSLQPYDVSELGDDEKFATGFRHADGSVAYVFSSLCRTTVLRHFLWMRE